MANTKYIHIEARAPWNWIEHLSEGDAAFFASVFLNSAMGLRLNQLDDGYEPVPETGGHCFMVAIEISGAEAMAYPALHRMIDALQAVGEVTVAEARDMDDPGPTHSLLTTKEA